MNDWCQQLVPITISLVLLITSPTGGQDASKLQNSPNGEQETQQELGMRIDRLISALGSRKFLEREKASRELWEIGLPAEKKIRAALNHPNAEVVARAQAILADFDFGIYAETDAATKATIIAFRDGNLVQKRTAGKQLLLQGEIKTLIKLMQKLEDQSIFGPLANDFFGNSQFVVDLIEKGEDQAAIDALRLLNESAESFGLNAYRQEELRTQFLWLLTINQSLSAEHGLVEESLAENQSDRYRYLSIRLLRAQDEKQRTLEASQQLNNDTFREQVLHKLMAEQHQWGELSNIYWTENRPPVTELDIPQLLAGLTYHRLAGIQDRFDSDLKVLFQFSDPFVEDLALDETSGLFEKVNNSTVLTIVEFLFTNGQSDKALNYLSRTDKFKAFEAFVAIDDHQQAFATLGIADITPATAKIFERQIKQYSPVRWSDSTEDIEKMASVVHAFYQLGFFDEAKSLWRTLYSAATRYETNQTGALAAVCNSLIINDQRDLMFELVETQLRQKEFDFALESLFGELSGEVDGVSLASYWWTVLESELSDRSALERLKFLDQTLRPLAPGEQPDPIFKKIVNQIEKEFDQEIGAGSWGDEAFLGHTYLLWNDRNKAKHWLSKYDFETSPNSDVAMQLGHLYFEDKQYELAADAYLNAWRFGQKNVSGVFFAGVAQRKAGLSGQADRSIALAKKLMISPDAIPTVASDLVNHQLEADAKPILEMAMRVAKPQSWEVGTARFRYINLLKDDQSDLAANLLENQLLDVVMTTRYYPSVASYSFYPLEIQLRTFDKHIADGQPELAFQAAKRALKIRPLSATVAEDYLPRLRKLPNGKELADQLFEEVRTAHKQQLQRFPNSGLYNNNLAWINSTNQMHLEEALHHAELAVKNEPNNPTYLDTLADVCFNLGQVSRSIQLMEKCLKYDPRSEHYNKQLERFRAASSQSEKK